MAETGDVFAFDAEQLELRRTVRRFCAEHSDEATVRRWMDSPAGYDPATWARLGGELGVLGLAAPDESGVVGGLVDQAVVAEELGAALLCGPVFGTIGLAIPALVMAGDGGLRDELLPPLVAGVRTAAFAVPERAGRFDPASITVGAVRAGGGWELTGWLAQVVDAAAADVLLVAASGPDGVALFAVEGTADGVDRELLSTMDLTRRQAAVRLSEAPARLLADPGDAERVIGYALDVGAVLLAAEQVGGAQRLLDLTVEYAKHRLQFGRPIGSFQAVKHRLADMLVAVEHARSTAYHAAWAIQGGTDDPWLATSIAQATCSQAYSRVAADTLQLHGGIGFTWEHQAHLYYKRAVTDAALLGSAEEHRNRIALAVLDRAVVPPSQVPPVAGVAEALRG
ncbi:acyl-CoA dehydrogenase family protein [Pseudonocardia asaccharolytica]|uniref:Acyl-CoA dehydrogenase n=1 Tax=Pseudonocardia asaccharolytica DSM 44247 = NBRC 16224 TaxID=1123024 RepID=A0A511CYC1_9PSEU|nr:acyl-CoA dehydrogenase family protein [Pseudonocardia asaccharolytica]GEL17555.1 acyl-CoA dehydrogenase [Pseudonocardia asaccharolytica DSM 44247 = NBRC 16224]